MIGCKAILACNFDNPTIKHGFPFGGQHGKNDKHTLSKAAKALCMLVHRQTEGIMTIRTPRNNNAQSK